MRISVTESHGRDAHVRSAGTVDEGDALLEGWLAAGGRKTRPPSARPPPDADADADAPAPPAPICDALADQWYR
jgi:hypothetical protein